MSKRPERAYGFTTTSADQFLSRIAREARPSDRFLFVNSRNVETNIRSTSVLIRAEALPDKPNGVSIFGQPLTKTWGHALRGTGFRMDRIFSKRSKGRPGKHETPAQWEKRYVALSNQARGRLQFLRNLALKRDLRVVVEAL